MKAKVAGARGACYMNMTKGHVAARKSCAVQTMRHDVEETIASNT